MIEVFQDGTKTNKIVFPGEVPIESTATLEFDITNPNSFPVELEVLNNPDDDFELQNVPERLPAKETGQNAKRFTITVEFSPHEGRPPFDVEQLFKVIW